ncbi:SDR family NAD(P)-dependent oxidoreductase [Pseudonocardia xinjiangensis]|uniref:SDR family NAD(P)-dependent oxidoreductase n=1 Tax=Pseudonocardia xinjiangensis TaxID=75289 RepID=UPI003D92F374
MATIVITGGTRGIGRALAHRRLAQGDTVVAVARSAANGERFLRESAEHGARARFIAADLSTLSGMRSAIDAVAAGHPGVDALVLGANDLIPRRAVTEDGFESVLALYYLSRAVLARELRTQLERTPQPVVLNLSGPGITQGGVQWDDPQLTRRWSGLRAQLQAGRANDLLGPALARQGGRTRYVVYNPGFVDTRPYVGMRQPWRVAAELAAAAFAAPPDRAAAAIGALLDAPPEPGFSAWRRRGRDNRRIDPALRTFDAADAERLERLTLDLLAAVD